MRDASDSDGSERAREREDARVDVSASRASKAPAPTRWRLYAAAALAALGTTLVVELGAARAVEGVFDRGYGTRATASLASDAPRRTLPEARANAPNASERVMRGGEGALGVREMTNATTTKRAVKAEDETREVPTAQVGLATVTDPLCDEWTTKLDRIVAGNAEFARMPSAYVCSNEHNSPCLFDFEFFRLVPNACSTLKNDDEWPGRFVQKEPGLLRGDDLIRALRVDGGASDGASSSKSGANAKTKQIVVIGASLTKQIEIGLDCSMQRAGLSSAEGRKRYMRWGWARFSIDNEWCRLLEKSRMKSENATVPSSTSNFFKMPEYLDGCWKNTTVFDQKVLGCDADGTSCDAKNRIVVLMYNIGHYGGVNKENLEAFATEVEFVARHTVDKGASVVLATSPPQHFSAQGAYTKEAYYKIAFNSTCSCQRTKTDLEEDEQWRRYFDVFENLSKIPGVLGVVDMLRSNMRNYHGAHKMGACGWSAARVPGDDPDDRKYTYSYRPCCDCSHYCFDPVLWDQFFITPLVNIINANKVDLAR